MRSLDIAEDTIVVRDDDAVVADCCMAYKLLNTTLLGILARPGQVDPHQAMLEGIKNILPIQTSAIYHVSPDSPKATPIANCGDMSAFAPTIQNFSQSLVDASAQSALWYCDERLPNLFIKAAQIKSNEYAILVLKCENTADTNKIQEKVVDVLAQGVAEVFSATHHAQINRRRVLQEERASISRELHDSLAQSLTYLKIQASRIESILNHEQSTSQDDKTEVGLVVKDLRHNLNIAYRRLRELMTTFRLTMNGENLNQAIEETITEFAKRTTIAFDLDYRLGNNELTTDEEMQILHIVREALSNIVRHSHAQRARVALRHDTDDRIKISIDDDGVGIDKTQRRAQHHGLVIMQERSQNLGGQFDVDQLNDGGTRLTITFEPPNRD
ncbi:MAG: hypothetical protein GY763_14145 [Gammaproteobacteria bacterium]|nr:hypothetical protein [Gammaproteobacteria bacterium]